VPILLYIAIWSCALGLAASMDAALPTAPADLGITDGLSD
jgi:hypothetical protein